jgi:hypothetical protein
LSARPRRITLEIPNIGIGMTMYHPHALLLLLPPRAGPSAHPTFVVVGAHVDG